MPGVADMGICEYLGIYSSKSLRMGSKPGCVRLHIRRGVQFRSFECGGTMNTQPPASRAAGPETSREAERYINASGLRSSQQRAVYGLIVSHPNHTTQELAALGILGRDEISR